ncbi:hypothetical protein [Bacillus amyloliquefaciens]|uniref:hypothetical protein n=1 Tax=Bacillus amyloliquefaciens TaxID=1390 RepID=UPI0028074B09|nr:hypothetical protein [Bacillus amyloliquefaciens]MDQ8091561.1 hypothetical protein [Bacillus amyloliquefaciens]
MQNYYHICRQHHGKVARITERNGRVHVGRIVRVTRSKVYISPVGHGGHRGYGYGCWGWGGWGAAYGIGLGLITGFALGGLLFW